MIGILITILISIVVGVVTLTVLFCRRFGDDDIWLVITVCSSLSLTGMVFGAFIHDIVNLW